MAVTVKPTIPATIRISPGGTLPERNYIDLEISFDSSYQSGGEPVYLNKYFNNLRAAVIENKDGYTFWYDRSTQLMHVYAAGVEVAAETDLSSLALLSVMLIGD